MSGAAQPLVRPDSGVVLDLEPHQVGAPPTPGDRARAARSSPRLDPVIDDLWADAKIARQRAVLAGVGRDRFDQADPDIAHFRDELIRTFGTPIRSRGSFAINHLNPPLAERPGPEDVPNVVEQIEAVRISGCMTPAQMTTEELELDREWRARFGQPLPMLGCADIVRRILGLPANKPA